MSRSLVLGVNGQDGSYLAQALLRRGHAVVGVGRDESSRYVPTSSRFQYVKHDLRDVAGLPRIVQQAAPDFAFHMAAIHGPAGFPYESVWGDLLLVNVAALHVLLEHARIVDRRMRVVYAGSAKIFPSPLAGTIDEATPARPTCLYGIGKIAARNLISHYRAHHGIGATNLVFFNHESPRRPPQYFIPTVARAIAEAIRDRETRVVLKTLDFRIDWSAAHELMDITAEIAERSEEDEFVLASGTTWYARDAIQALFAANGLEADRHVVETTARSDPGPEFRVSIDRLERAIGRRPRATLVQIVDEMIRPQNAADVMISRDMNGDLQRPRS